jgi:eukaryotic-like serine/threonine-protein kinase
MKSFPPFRLDPINHCLWRADQRVSVAPKPFDMLRYLVEHPGRLVTPDEILEALWPETYVNPEVVRKYIKEIRKILGDSPSQPTFIETIPKRGYQFIAAVTDETSPALAQVPPASKGEGENPAPDASNDQGSTLPAPVVWGQIISRKNVWKIAAAIAVLVVAVLVVSALYWDPVRAAKLTDKDTIVLADFENKTGDAVFNDTLKQGLSVQLEQSPFLSMVSPAKVNQTLKLMGRSAGDFLTPEVTREVCQRTGSKAMLTGSIVSLGSQYVIGLKAVNCYSGDVLAEAQEQVAAKEAVLKALDVAAVHIRGELGESLSSVKKYDTPLVDATTPSLDALQAYSLGRKMAVSKGQAAALPFYQHALELDSNFALAYLGLGIAYSSLAQPDRGAEYAHKAYELRQKVSERERLAIEAFFYRYGTGELQKAAQIYDLWRQNYPRDLASTTGNLGYIHNKLGNWEQALQEHRELLRLQPDVLISYVALFNDYICDSRLVEAEALYKQAEQRSLDVEVMLPNRYQLAFLEGDSTQMAQLALAAMGKPGIEDVILNAQADTATWYGHFKEAHQLAERATDSARHYDALETAATYQAEAALREVESGYPEQARADANTAIKLFASRDVRPMAALALARAGQTFAAEKLAAELDKLFPLDITVQQYWLPTIRAAISLERKHPEEAVELLNQATALEFAIPNNFVVFVPAYVRGEAYLALRDGNRAAEEFQKFVRHPGVVGSFPWGVLARLGLARAYALMLNSAAREDADNLRAQVRAKYQDFLTLWKDADPDIPILKQAKAEYAKLN